MQGRNLEFDLRYFPGSSATVTQSYVGSFRLQQAELHLHRDLPFHFDISNQVHAAPGLLRGG